MHSASQLAEEVQPTIKLPEGARKQIVINAYERNSVARAICIEYAPHEQVF
jgi:hypothetical protein